MILDGSPGDERPLYATFAYTGMRFGEARDLKWSDIEFRDGGGTIYIRRGGSRKDMTKSGKSRPIPMTPELHVILSSIERRGENVFYHPATRMHPAGSRVLEETELLKRFKRLCKRIGFPDWRKAKLHTFRHFFASICARNNVSYKYALRWMGHQSSEILDLYFHIHDREAQRAINGLNFGTTPSPSTQATGTA